MKKLFTCFAVLVIYISCSSFKTEGYRDLYKEDGSISATINGQTFQLRETGFYRAMLVTKINASAASGRQLSRTAASLIFYGVDTAEAGRSFSESITIEYTFSPSPGEGADVSFDMSYNFGEYYVMPERNYFKASKIEWSADKTYFVLSGKFECLMHRRGYSADLQPAVRVKGEVSDIKVSVPPWIASKLNTEASVGE